MRYTLSTGKTTADFTQAQTWAQSDSIKTGKAIIIIDNNGLSGLGSIVAVVRAGVVQLMNA